MITIADIEAAQDRISPYVRRTPIIGASRTRDPLPVSASVTMKLELHQVTGSFKARGAMNRLLGTPPLEIEAGIVTASGGNHGLAVARTAKVAGVPAVIYVPGNVSPAKVAKMREWGADVRTAGADWSASNEAALEYARTSGASYFHPFADPLVVAGQGTLGLEILDQTWDFDTIVVAVGGGGLISGLSTAIKAQRPDVRVVAVEPTGSPTMKASLDAGEVVTLPKVTSRVATMSCRRTDERVFELARRNIAEVVLVSDDAMLAASRWLWFEFGIAADLSGAASIAALQSGHPVFADSKRICALICGAGAEGTVS
ncbi:threonine/serine dehydratase [Mesorhizobium sp. YM1C-6-2]|uniref:threonine ammonia-lyase n=1 Tax=Mesorhizobium sp. YM1C-6-2 TaxID=1827501 RepID=UPI000EF2895F|nr:threonine/serine dehydratase [Mesorhizobium sp. YM1C-6-2]RLP28121.1 threonine/serine dehydratase [Mesorhizobium sp. YM1C-6-2]